MPESVAYLLRSKNIGGIEEGSLSELGRNKSTNRNQTDSRTLLKSQEQQSRRHTRRPGFCFDPSLGSRQEGSSLNILVLNALV